LHLIVAPKRVKARAKKELSIYLQKFNSPPFVSENLFALLYLIADNTGKFLQINKY